MDHRSPLDTELLAAGEWSGVDGVRVLAKGWHGAFCAAVINTHDGDESSPYHAIVECFVREEDDLWHSLGHHGPISRGEGSGTFSNNRGASTWSYEYGWSEADESWWVIALVEP